MSILFSLDSVSKTYGSTTALAPLTMTVPEGRSLGIIGESGSGKTTLTRIMLGLLEPSTGTVTYRGRPVTSHERGPTKLRRDVQLVLQDPYSSLNPRMTIGNIIREPLRLHKSPGNHLEIVEQSLADVGIDPAWSTRLPHQLSGGQRQRVAIARALAARPSVIIADEPVSALDVSVRVTIVDLLASLVAERGLTLIVVSHDLGIVQNLCEDTMVLAGGVCVEHRPTADLLANPHHDTTIDLVEAVPELPL